MQNFGSEVGQLGSFIETHVPNRVGVFHETGVVVVHAVDIGPDLYFGGSDGSSHEGRTVIASTTTQIIYFAFAVRADKPLCHIEGVGIGSYRGQGFAQPFGVDFFLLIGYHEIGRVEVYRLGTRLVQVESKDCGGQQFSLRDDFSFGSVFLEV